TSNANTAASTAAAVRTTGDMPQLSYRARRDAPRDVTIEPARRQVAHLPRAAPLQRLLEVARRDHQPLFAAQLLERDPIRRQHVRGPRSGDEQGGNGDLPQHAVDEIGP